MLQVRVGEPDTVGLAPEARAARRAGPGGRRPGPGLPPGARAPAGGSESPNVTVSGRGRLSEPEP
jgi:hypothetical protein